MIEITKDYWQFIWKECLPLMAFHNDEVREENPDLPFEVDVEGAQRLEDLGMLECFTARQDKELVGYLFWFIVPVLESKGQKAASMGPFYVDPDCAGAGSLLWNTSVGRLRFLGIHTAYAHHSTFGPRSRLARGFFEGKGGKLFEMKYLFRW